MKKIKNPLLLVIAIYILCFEFRLLEYFSIRTDQTFWGEAFLHKLMGIIILGNALKFLSSDREYIGFKRRGVFSHLLMGLLFGLVMFALAYGVEIMMAVSRGSFRAVQFYVSSYAVDGNTGNQTGVLFFIICILGNILNVVMEEGVYRGLFQKILEQKYNFIVSMLTASLLFGLWHVVGPIRNYYDGLSSASGMAANIMMLVITSGLGGVKFALLTRMTGSLYMAMGDHFVNNAIVNLLHVISFTGADELMLVRMAVAQSLSFLIVLLYYFMFYCGRRKRVREL